MRLATWNILHGKILDLNSGPDAFKAAILTLNSDLIGLQEVDHLHPRSDLQNQAAMAAAAMNTSNWAFVSAFYFENGNEIALKSDDLGLITSSSPSEKAAYGIAIISRLPVSEWKVKKLRRAKWGKMMNISEGAKSRRFYATDHNRIALAAVLQSRIVINTHLSFVWPFNLFQFQEVKKWARELGQLYGLPVLIMGDFNLFHAPRFSHWHSMFEAETFPIWNPDRQIDYVLSTHEKSVSGATHSFGVSDHLALTIELGMHVTG